MQAKEMRGMKYQGKLAPTKTRAETKAATTAKTIGRYSFFFGMNRRAPKPPIHQPSRGKLNIPTLKKVTNKFIDPIKPLSRFWNTNRSKNSCGAKYKPQAK